MIRFSLNENNNNFSLQGIDFPMATDSEKRLLKEFLNTLDTIKLCEIVRSVYHGGGTRAHTREGI